MIVSSRIINKQLQLLKEAISTFVDCDYVYLDVPSYLNYGDWLIAMGAFNLLKELPYKCLYYASSVNYQKQYIPKNAIILLNGGGNFGNLYYGATEFRNEVIEDFPNNKIVILPQTITYTNSNLIDKEANIYSKHKNLHICARDNESYLILQKYFHENSLYLLPDTAIGLYSSLPKYDMPKSSTILEIRRKDKENSNAQFTMDINENAVVADWNKIFKEIHIDVVLFPWRILKILSRAFHGMWSKIQDLYLLHVMYPYVFSRVSKYMLRFDRVHTTRLHGFILCMMMHIPIEWVDTKYGKLSGYINTWIKDE